MKYTDPTGLFNWKTNMIEANDTLANIAEEYNHKNGSCITYEAIANINGISDPNHIEIGNKLSFEGLSYNDISPRGYNPANFKNQNPDISKVNKKINVNISVIEDTISSLGNTTFLLGDLFGNETKIGNTLSTVSTKLGYLTTGIDLIQFIKTPTLDNSLDLSYDGISYGLSYIDPVFGPYAGMFLQAYHSYQKNIYQMFNSSKMYIQDDFFIGK